MRDGSFDEKIVTLERVERIRSFLSAELGTRSPECHPLPLFSPSCGFFAPHSEFRVPRLVGLGWEGEVSPSLQPAWLRHRLAMAGGHAVLAVRAAGHQPRGLPLPPLPIPYECRIVLCVGTHIMLPFRELSS